MNIINSIISILTLIFSAGTFGFSLYEKCERRKAHLNGSISFKPNIDGVLTIKNSGQAIARNVRLECLNDSIDIFHRHDMILPCDIPPQESININICFYEGYKPRIHVRFIWDDNSDKNNIEEQVLSLR